MLDDANYKTATARRARHEVRRTLQKYLVQTWYPWAPIRQTSRCIYVARSNVKNFSSIPLRGVSATAGLANVDCLKAARPNLLASHHSLQRRVAFPAAAAAGESTRLSMESRQMRILKQCPERTVDDRLPRQAFLLAIPVLLVTAFLVFAALHLSTGDPVE